MKKVIEEVVVLTPAEERRLVLAERKAAVKARDLDRQQKRQTKRGQLNA